MTKVFTYNRHTAYLYMLSRADIDLYVAGGWSENARPKPNNITLVQNEEIDEVIGSCDVWLSHLITPDLIEFVKRGISTGWPDKIIQVMHGRVDRTGHVEPAWLEPMYALGKRVVVGPLELLRRTRPVEFTYISESVASSFSPIDGTTIHPGALTDEIEPTGIVEREQWPLTVANDINRGHFDTPALTKLNQETDLHTCGSNEDSDLRPGRVPWSELKRQYRNALCYCNLVRPPENSFNLATLEALASGTPIVTTEHPDSVFKHEKNALVCETPQGFVEAVHRLQQDRELAADLSTSSRELAEKKFSLNRFVSKWEAVISNTNSSDNS